MSQRPETMFAIAVDDEAVGGMGFTVLTDVERVSAEIGYWLGEPFWGRGIVTEALVAVTQYAIDTCRLTRVYALPFAHNKASCRVLEKAGYIARMPSAPERDQGWPHRRPAAVLVYRGGAAGAGVGAGSGGVPGAGGASSSLDFTSNFRKRL